MGHFNVMHNGRHDVSNFARSSQLAKNFIPCFFGIRQQIELLRYCKDFVKNIY